MNITLPITGAKPDARQKEGQTFFGSNISKFAREQNVAANGLSRVMAGTLKHYRGWVRAETINN